MTEGEVKGSLWSARQALRCQLLHFPSYSGTEVGGGHRLEAGSCISPQSSCAGTRVVVRMWSACLGWAQLMLLP